MQSLIGLTVAQALALCGAGYDEVRLLDDPPGKLKAIAFPCRKAEVPTRLTVEIEYSDALFSRGRAWPREVVESRKVIAVLDDKGSIR